MLIDHHLHLYGCLTPEDIWKLGRDLTPDPARQRWYEDEFLHAYGRPSQWSEYWSSDAGVEKIAGDYLCTSPCSFAQFQASFNLVIALFPLEPNKSFLLRPMMERHRAEGLVGVEYRSFLSPSFSASEAQTYLQHLCREADRFEKESAGSFTPRLRISIPRPEKFFRSAASAVETFLQQNPSYRQILVGIDFCGDEETDPPRDKKDFLQSTTLDVSYHVGESFQNISIASSARRVWEAASFGVKRLAHAVSLAMDPNFLKNQVAQELVRERLDHLQFILEHQDWFPQEQNEARREIKILALEKPENRVSIRYDSEFLEKFQKLQQNLLKDLATKPVQIETCPTSNVMISLAGHWSAHPLRRFLAAGLTVVLGSDDPGIFATSLSGEIVRCREQLALTDREIASLVSKDDETARLT